MSATIGWSVAAILGFFLAIVQWSWRKHATESLAQSEFIAILFLDPVIYENNKRAFVEWLDELPQPVHIGHVRGASRTAQNIATSCIGQLGVTSGLFAVLENYNSSRTRAGRKEQL
jgi:hypothetical protein